MEYYLEYNGDPSASSYIEGQYISSYAHTDKANNSSIYAIFQVNKYPFEDYQDPF